MAKDFLVFLILDPILLLFPNIYGPNLVLYREFLAKFQEFLKPKYKKFIKMFKSTHMIDQRSIYNIKTLCDRYIP